MLTLTASERSCWITLLCYASVNNNAVITFLNEEQLMLQAGISFNNNEWNRTKGVLKRFKKLKMIDYSNGKITLRNWSKRQEIYSKSYERLKRWREKKRLETFRSNAKDNGKNRVEENRIDKNVRPRFNKKGDYVLKTPKSGLRRVKEIIESQT